MAGRRAAELSGSSDAVLARIRAIPPGFVRTYGDVSPGAPRFAGSVLQDLHEPGLPWWRVVRADGSLAQGGEQRRRLVAEGVPFRGKRVDMEVARLGEGWEDPGRAG
jgi:methylated-DNA-protein-cysteine methyltransferase related protein